MAVKNISAEEVQRLLTKNILSLNDRFLIDSFVYQPLVDYCNDIRPNEIEKVRRLEEKNIFRYLNASCIILGVYGMDILTKALATPPLSYVIQELQNEYTGKELEKNVIIVSVKILLAIGGHGGGQITTPVFEGEMPQKFMSFRNQTAKEWFGNFVNIHLFTLAAVYEKASSEEAKAHLLASIAYHLHQSNPTKYDIDANISMDDALRKILLKFHTEQGGDSSTLYSNTGEILSKAL